MCVHLPCRGVSRRNVRRVDAVSRDGCWGPSTPSSASELDRTSAPSGESLSPARCFEGRHRSADDPPGPRLNTRNRKETEEIYERGIQCKQAQQRNHVCGWQCQWREGGCTRPRRRQPIGKHTDADNINEARNVRSNFNFVSTTSLAEGAEIIVGDSLVLCYKMAHE